MPIDRVRVQAALDQLALDAEHRALLASIRARLGSGDLPGVGAKMFAGNGSVSSFCVVCHAPIKRTQVQYEIALHGKRRVTCHLHCYYFWRSESDRRTA